MNTLNKAEVAADPVLNEQYLTFMLGGEVFALGILAVKEIIEYGRITEIPMAPRCFRGVINLRGAVLPVIDLSIRIGREASAVARRTCIVVIDASRDGSREEVGIVVDAVNAVLDIPATEFEPAPRFGATIRTEFIRGLGKVDGQFVIILDADQILGVDDLNALAAAVAGSGVDAVAAA